MESVFLVCFAIGGTLLVCQFLMSLLGLGGEAFHADVPHDFGHDLGGDAGHAGGDFHPAADYHLSPTHIFDVLSFRTVVAALTFFGLGGLIAASAGASLLLVWLSALGGGAAAMYGVYWLMRLLYSLRCEGTLDIQRALGESGSMYLPIPAGRAGAGKVQLTVQGQLIEYLAVTSGQELRRGTPVSVVAVVGPDTVEVEPSSPVVDQFLPLPTIDERTE